MKKKVMIISETTSGGVRKHILDLLFNLDIKKYDVYFAYSTKRADETMMTSIPKLKNRNIHLIELKYLDREINPIKEIKALKELNKIIKRVSPDIVHCHSSKAGALGRVSAKMQGIKYIYYTPHAYIMQNPSTNKIKKIVFANIERILSKYFTTKTINVSKGEKEFALQLKIDKQEKFQVIYNGIDESFENKGLSNFKSQLNINDGDVVVGVAARMDEQKDPFTFVKIAETICKQIGHVKFIYIGDGIYKKKVECYIRDKGLDKNIILLGFRKDVEQILKYLDIYIITSLYEGLPYSLIEALKNKLPIIASNVVGNNEIVENGYNGFLFNVKDIADGSEKLLKCIENKKLCKVMSQNSFNLFKDKFTLKKMVKNIENLYDSN